MSNKRVKLTIEDAFDAIPPAITRNVSEQGLMGPWQPTRIPFDLRNTQLRWEICCALEFLSNHAWYPGYKCRKWHSPGLQCHAEDYARQHGIAQRICHGAIIIACRLAQIPEINGKPSPSFKLSLNYNIVSPYAPQTADGESQWKNKRTQEYASMALICSLDNHLHDDLIHIIAFFINILFQPAPTYRLYARNMHARLKHFALDKQNQDI